MYFSVKQEDMTPPNSTNPGSNAMIKEECNAETGSESGNTFGQSSNGNATPNSGQMQNASGQGSAQQQQSHGQNANSNSKQCNNAEVCVCVCVIYDD